MTTTTPGQRPLPPDLATAEQDLLEACTTALTSGDSTRWSAALRFENLRVLPVALRLARALIDAGRPVVLLWPDAGAAALARRDAEDLAERVLDFKQWSSKEDPPANALLLVVAPQPSEYDEFAEICGSHSGPVLMLNGRLEDAAVGIGSVARERRKGFVSVWSQAYWLEPIDGGAVMRVHPEAWNVYRADPDGYRAVAELETRPDPETINAILAGEDGPGLKQQLGNVDRFLDGLRN